MNKHRPKSLPPHNSWNITKVTGGLHENSSRPFPKKSFLPIVLVGWDPFPRWWKSFFAIAVPGLTEIVSGKVGDFDEHRDFGNTKAQFLAKWDQDTEDINKLWAEISEARYQEHVKLFGQYEGSVQSSILYFIDNEVHHRGQGYVYLRSLGIEPPFFYDRD